MAEWLKAHAWKVCDVRNGVPGFESLLLRQFHSKDLFPVWDQVFCFIGKDRGMDGGQHRQWHSGSGHCYAIALSDGTYVLVRPTVYPPNVSGMPVTTTFEYCHQKNGTRNF